MTGISQNKLSKKQQRKKEKQRQKRWKRINAKIDNTIAGCVILVAVGIGIMEMIDNRKK